MMLVNIPCEDKSIELVYGFYHIVYSYKQNSAWLPCMPLFNESKAYCNANTYNAMCFFNTNICIVPIIKSLIVNQHYKIQ